MILSLVLACLVTAPSQGTAPGYRNARYGFSLERPGEDWIWSVAEKQAGASFVFSLFPRGTQGLPSAVVYVADAGPAVTAELACESGFAKLRAQGAQELERAQVRVADQPAPCLSASLSSALGPYVVRYVFHVEHGYLYTLQLARAPDDAASEALLQRVLDSLAFQEPVREVEDPARAAWRALAAGCAADLGWCASWDEAARRAREEGKLVLVTVQNYAALQIPNTLRSGPFLDPDFAALVRERFVPLELGASMEAPFRAPSSYGLSRHAWGTAFLFADADGRVLDECGISDATYLDDFARAVLARQGRAATGNDAGETVERALARGELERALTLLEGDDTPRAHRLRAAVARRRRDGPGALAELHAAHAQADEELEPELEADEAIVHLRMEEFDDARRRFEHVLEAWPEHPRSAEASFWLGAMDVARLGLVGGAARWRELVERSPGSPWAAKAAANLLGEGHLVGGAERFGWPAPELLATVQRVELAAKPGKSDDSPDSLERIQRDAVAWLLAHQRPDGTWWVPMDGFSLGSSLYTPAVSALCAVSLLPEKSSEARTAIERTLAWALEAHEAGRFDGSATLAGVYSIWSRVYVLQLFVAARRAGLGAKERLSRAIPVLVASIGASQDRRGGWPYVIFPGDPDAQGLDPSASFLTAGVLLTLLDARAAEVDVDAGVLERGLAFLARLLQPDGTFRYMPDLPGEVVDGRRPEALGRGPLCAYALLRGERGELATVRRALELFVSGRAGTRAEWHKSLCHTAPEGFGAHYLLYDYLFAARAMRELPSTERGPVRAALVDDLLGERFSDGSFEDLPGLGRAYGTAMALEALRLCER